MTVLGMRTSWRGPALVAVICIALVVAIAVGVEGLYPNLDQRVEYAATAGVSSISTAFNGRGYALTSLGGITGIEVGFMGQLLFPILGVVTAIGLTRRQEEAGRTELLTASRVGRLAPLAAAALHTPAADLQGRLRHLLAMLTAGEGLLPRKALPQLRDLAQIIDAAPATICRELGRLFPETTRQPQDSACVA